MTGNRNETLTTLSATDLAGRIRSQEISSVEVVRAHLERIAAVNQELRAVVQLRAEAALAEAAERDAQAARGDFAGPLHGVPFTVKDWIETNDLPCAGGLPERRDHVPRHDATAVARMRAAGAILLGKTKPGLADDTHPRARNPLDSTRSAGGSSGGEAAIIAAGGSPVGLGSDSGGSLRWPAHCSGIMTLRPTAGLVPNTGHFPRINPMADPRTVIGPMARSVDDLELALSVIAGADGLDASTVPVPVQATREVDLSELRVAWFAAFADIRPTPAVERAVAMAVHRLSEAGAEVFQAVPPRLKEALPLTQAYWARPESSSWSAWVAPRASTLDADAVERSLFEWDRFRRAMLGFMHDVDLIVCPVAADVAPLFDAPVPVETWLYMLPFSLSNNPVAVVPSGEADQGMPIGVQLVARSWEDHIALAAARIAAP